MKKIGFALIGAVALTLAACGGREEDTLTDNLGDNAQADELNALAGNAAADANAELEALGNQQQQLESEAANETDALNGVTTEPSEVEDDVQGM